MTPSEIIKAIRSMTQDGLITIAPGPFCVKFGENDRRAIELFSWIDEHWQDLTIGEIEEVIDTAKWWLIFFSALHCLNHDTRESSDGG